MTEAYDGRQVVGMDLHRRRSVLVRMTMDGRKLETVRMENSPQALRAEIAKAGKNPLVVLEATYGWYWAADVLAAAGAEVHLAHPLGVRAFSYRRVKNDERDAADLADLLRMGRLPEAWIAPAEVRGLREITRYRRGWCSSGPAPGPVRAVLAKLGVPVRRSGIFRPGGGIWLDQLVLPLPYAGEVASLRTLIAVLDTSPGSARCRGMLAGDRGYPAVRSFRDRYVARRGDHREISDVTRFRKPGQWLCQPHLAPPTTLIRPHLGCRGSGGP